MDIDTYLNEMFQVYTCAKSIKKHDHTFLLVNFLNQISLPIGTFDFDSSTN